MNDPFNAIVLAASPALTTFASTRRRSMSTKRYPEILLLLLVLASNDRSGQIGSERLVAVLEHLPRAAKEVMAGATAGTYLLPASVLRSQRSAGTTAVDVRLL